jgi:hypothetical protein
VLNTFVVVMLILWAVGLVSGNALGGMIHLLLVLALIVLGFRVLSGRRIL